MKARNAQMTESDQRCPWKLATKKGNTIASDPPTVENYYDAYFRMRDDLGFQPALHKGLIPDLATPPANITIRPCRPAYGMHDRFASVSPDVARHFFHRSFAIFSAQ
jgi:hypothetical protein